MVRILLWTRSKRSMLQIGVVNYMKITIHYSLLIVILIFQLIVSNTGCKPRYCDLSDEQKSNMAVRSLVPESLNKSIDNFFELLSTGKLKEAYSITSDDFKAQMPWNIFEEYYSLPVKVQVLLLYKKDLILDNNRTIDIVFHFEVIASHNSGRSRMAGYSSMIWINLNNEWQLQSISLPPFMGND